MINLVALATGGRAEKRTAEYRIAELRRVESLRSVFFINKNRLNAFLRYPAFDIHDSIFDIHFFFELSKADISFFDQTGCFFGPRLRLYGSLPMT